MRDLNEGKLKQPLGTANRGLPYRRIGLAANHSGHSIAPISAIVSKRENRTIMVKFTAGSLRFNNGRMKVELKTRRLLLSAL
jgi:hypothetical protein